MAQRRRSKGPGPSREADEEEGVSLSQPQRDLGGGSQDQVNQKVSELVQFLLVKDQRKIPIKRAEMLKKVLPGCRALALHILTRARSLLEQVFGLRLVALDRRQQLYILTNGLARGGTQGTRGGTQSTRGTRHSRRWGGARLGLLSVLLSFIFMKGNSARDGAVWEFLRRLRVFPGERHEVFGDVKKLVTEEFVRQKYLEITPIPMSDPPEFSYQWGPRAEQETSRRDLLLFVAKIQGKDPTFWMSQYAEAEATP